jgi:hypothetical protein
MCVFSIAEKHQYKSLTFGELKNGSNDNCPAKFYSTSVNKMLFYKDALSSSILRGLEMKQSLTPVEMKVEFFWLIFLVLTIFIYK